LSQRPIYVSSSYRSNRLGLLHWDPYAVCRGGCLELYYCNMVEWFWWDSSLILTGMVTSSTVLVLEDSSRTNSLGLGVGLEVVWPWPWPRMPGSKVIFHGLDIKLHNLCAVTDKFFGCFFPFTCCWRVTGRYIYLCMTWSAALTLVVFVYSQSYIFSARLGQKLLCQLVFLKCNSHI